MTRRRPDADALARRLTRAPDLCPEQIVALGDADTPAVLVDQWGRAHPLEPRTVVGRDPDEATITVLQASISRRHAELTRDGAGAWHVRDLGSTNGTFVDGERVDGLAPLAAEQLVTFGRVGFVFVADGATLAARTVTESIRRTASTPLAAAPALRLAEPSGGGGGVLHVGEQALKLGVTQLALVAALAARRRADAALAEEVRGFVRSAELLADLPWDTPHPDENHLKQLVRRLRRALEKAGVADLVESRHGFGYRLRTDVAPAAGSP